MKKIVLTGAAGSLGQQLRAPLSAMCQQLVSVDIADTLGATLSNEIFVQADIADLSTMETICVDADRIVHFAAFVDERDFDTLLRPNFVGTYNVWEAARRCGVPRIVYASSIHAVGLTEMNQAIDHRLPHHPDSFYGLSKCFAEDLARLYWYKAGTEAVCLRIAACTAKPMNRRALALWLSYPDLVQLVKRSVDTLVTRFCTVYGVSNNDRSPFDNSAAAFLGYRPKDNAEDYAETLINLDRLANPKDDSVAMIAGPFATAKLGASAHNTVEVQQQKQ